MDTLLQDIEKWVSDAGGSLPYPQILEKAGAAGKPLLPRALKQLRAENKLTQTVEFVDGKIIHTYHKV